MYLLNIYFHFHLEVGRGYLEVALALQFKFKHSFHIFPSWLTVKLYQWHLQYLMSSLARDSSKIQLVRKSAVKYSI